MKKGQTEGHAETLGSRRESSWQTKPLEEVCNVEYGTRVVQKRDGGKGFPVYGGGGATFEMDGFNREDRLVIARFGMSEECTRFVAGKFFLNDSGLTVSPKNGAMHQRFLDYQMLALNDDIYALGKGTAQKNLDVPVFRTVPLFVPESLAEQQRIVVLLDEAFAGLATAKANAEKNLQNARALFESHLQSVFTQRGQGWVETTIGELCDIKHGYAFDGAEFSNDVPDGNPLVVTPGNFTEDGKLLFNERNTKRFSGSTPAGFQFGIGDLVVVMTDLSSKMKILGKPAFVETDDVLHNQRIGRLVFLTDRVEKRLLYYFMMTEGFLKNIKMSSTGTMVKHTAPKRIMSNVIPFPANRKEQRAIVTTLDDLREETQRLARLYERKRAALEALKKSLLHQAFTGEL